jgi:bacterioferritin (cytochrome b1)
MAWHNRRLSITAVRRVSNTRPGVDRPAGDSPIFSPALKARIGEAHIEMTALSVGLQIELASVERYRRLADTADTAELKEFFAALAHWEEGHADALGRQSRNLLESYWNEARFAPF